MLKSSITELVGSWEAYRSRKTTNKDHRMHQLVVDEIPRILESWTPNSGKYKFSGSDGQGNILRTPWFATLDLDVTDSATKGYYLVYLLSADLKTLVLEIGFGAHQFEKQYGRGKRFFDALDSAVLNMRVNSAHLVESTLNFSKASTNLIPVKLDDSGDFHLRAYEKCAIYSMSYEVENLPTDLELKRDYLEYVKLYYRMSESLLLADVDSYVYELVDEPKAKAEIKIVEFTPRVFKKRKTSENNSYSNSGTRYSKKSDKVGKLGEQIVFDFEINRLKKANKKELSEKVIWHRDSVNNRTPGWDITSFNEDGSEIYIEVKASEGQRISDVELTINEWINAEKFIDTNQYRVILVTNVFGDPVLEHIENPALMVKKGVLTLSVARYQLLLGPKVQ